PARTSALRKTAAASSDSTKQSAPSRSWRPMASGAEEPEAHVGRGIALIVATTVCFATLDTLSKLINKFLPINEIIWGRYAFHGLALTLLIGPRLKLDLVRTVASLDADPAASGTTC